MHVCMHTYTFIFAYTHTHIHTCVLMLVKTYLRTYITRITASSTTLIDHAREHTQYQLNFGYVA